MEEQIRTLQEGERAVGRVERVNQDDEGYIVKLSFEIRLHRALKEVDETAEMLSSMKGNRAQFAILDGCVRAGFVD